MIYTYAFLDLPDLPKNIIDSAWISLEKNKTNDSKKVNDWSNRPGYTEYEYRSFNLPDGRSLKTIKSHRYPINQEFSDWVKKYFDQDPTTSGIAYYDNHSSLFAPHVDISRDFTILYLLALGGDSVDTVWYQEKNKPITRPDLKSVFDLSQIPCDYSNLIEIDRVCLPLGKWVCINSAILHEVQNIHSTRVAIQVSRNKPLKNIKFNFVSIMK